MCKSQNIHLLASCPPLNNHDNGMINCSLGDDGVLSYEDTCTITCNTGYQLTGSSDTIRCESDGTWSGLPVTCAKMKCSISSLPIDSRLAESCSNTYQSTCELQCQEGFNGTGGSLYMCDINGSSVMWRPVGEVWRCEGGCLLIINCCLLHL